MMSQKEDAWNRSVEMMRKVCDYAKANDIFGGNRSFTTR